MAHRPDVHAFRAGLGVARCTASQSQFDCARAVSPSRNGVSARAICTLTRVPRCCDTTLFARSSVARQLDLDQQSHTVRPLLSSRVNSNSSLSLALHTSVSRVRHLSACLICVTSTSCSLTAAARTSSTTTPMPTFSQIGCADSPQSALSESESRSRTWPQLTKLATDWGDFGPAFDDELASEPDESASY